MCSPLSVPFWSGLAEPALSFLSGKDLFQVCLDSSSPISGGIINWYSDAEDYWKAVLCFYIFTVASQTMTERLNNLNVFL